MPLFEDYQDPRMVGGGYTGMGSDADWWSANVPGVAPASGQLNTEMPGGTTPPRVNAGAAVAGSSLPQAGGDPKAFILQWQATHPASEGIEPLAAALKQQFGIDRFMYGNTPSNNEFNIGGEKFKVVGGEDSPNSSYWYKPGMDDGGGGGFGGFGSNGGGNLLGFGSLAQTYGKENPGFQPLPEFAGPTPEEFRNSPGYDFALTEGLKGIDRGAASHGTLLTGGNLKARAQYATGLADQTFGDSWNRSAQQYGINSNRNAQAYGLNASNFDRNYNLFRTDRGDIFDRFYKTAGLGVNAATGATA